MTIFTRIQEHDIGALQNLACHEDNKVKTGESGAIDMILTSMKAYLSIALVQEGSIMH